MLRYAESVILWIFLGRPDQPSGLFSVTGRDVTDWF